MSEAAVNGNDLIVDFSYRRRPIDTDSKQVSFSEDITIHRFQNPSREEISKRWLSKRDKSLSTLGKLRDIQTIRYQLSISPMKSEKETLYACVGLEAHVSDKVTRSVAETKRGHARSIVRMQDCLSDEQLAAYAATRSSQSRERAQKLAAGYLVMLS